MTKTELLARPFVAKLTHRAATSKDQDRWMVSVDGFVTTFSKGTGLREGVKDYRTVWEQEQFRDHRKSRPIDPTMREVVECLALDAQSYVDALDVDDFAANYGFEKPSEAIKAWEGCRAVAKFFQERGLSPHDFGEEDDASTGTSDD